MESHTMVTQACSLIVERSSALMLEAVEQLEHNSGYVLEHLGSIGLPTIKTAHGSLEDVLEDVKDGIETFPVKRRERLREKLKA